MIVFKFGGARQLNHTYARKRLVHALCLSKKRFCVCLCLYICINVLDILHVYMLCTFVVFVCCEYECASSNLSRGECVCVCCVTVPV